MADDGVMARLAKFLSKSHDEAVGDRAEDVRHIWKQGFPTGTDQAEAIAAATLAARKAGEDGEIISVEIIETDAHKAAGEFLVKLCLGEKVSE